jgi:hypothetical protein
MRRSGTTILYDALLEDPELDCHYEPLREQGETVGGGSGARESDAFARTRALRQEFRDREHPELDIDEFNWGGPRLPDVELDPELPEHCSGFLRHLLSLAPDTLIKETRLYCKVPAIAELDPGAAFVHVVRDPRAVTASIVLGRGRRRQRKIGGVDEFFEYRSERKLWSSRRLSELLLERPENADLGPNPPDFMRVLLVWRETLAAARRDGQRAFGDRYVLLRNEDLRADPATALGAVYAALGREVPGAVAAWAAAHVREVEEPYAAEDPRWREALERLGMDAALAGKLEAR